MAAIIKIIVDAFGGDNAPGEILLGCVRARNELGVEIILSGNREEIIKSSKALECYDDISRMEILDCSERITMDDDPMAVIKAKKDSSMAVGMRALSEGKADAFASAGNSGALVVGASMIVKRLKGIKRVTFAAILPKADGFVMFSDAGANVDCRPEMLLQFGTMASVYMEKVMGIDNPRVGLANVGTEENKGDELRAQAFKLLSGCNEINFIGNVEAREFPFDAADVIVSDGFTGNIAIKLYEGVAMAMMEKIRGILSKNTKGKIAGSLIYKDLKLLKKNMDYNEYGGAPIMGTQKPVFKIHGSAGADTVFSALRLTKAYVEAHVNDKIAKAIANT